MPITFLIFFILSNHSFLTAADGNSPPPLPMPRTAALKPGIAAVLGILTTIFSITFLLLLYVKHCKGSSYANASRGNPASTRDSGINRKVIESLPMFRFSSLRGHKDGLECAVCLNKFEAEEVLRLLPKCKHAFHVECVDTWLDAHSTCPLCRYRVDPEDVLLHTPLPTPRTSAAPAPAPRVSGRHSSAGERGAAAASDNDLLRGRGSLDSWNSRRKTSNSGGRGRKDGQLPVQGDRHRLEHRIIISGEEEERLRRWSDVQAAESLYLKSEMLLGGGESGSGVINGRSVSEITGMSRYKGNNGGKEEEEERERVVKRWLAWISQSQHPAVQSPSSLPI
ncbi:RING-type E3 ubiquitin transferase [Salvia divinorum]|uniref:RING-type E3 ubiquitin transferase n=1 Tax=Salvia divinorum TaxID=28513 RepID=A0ABD1GY02_SALDI